MSVVTSATIRLPGRREHHLHLHEHQSAARTTRRSSRSRSAATAPSTTDSDPVLPAPANARASSASPRSLGTGQAVFSNVAPGTYAVDELVPPRAGWDFTEPDVCSTRTTRPARSTVSGDVATHQARRPASRHLHLPRTPSAARVDKVIERGRRQRHLQVRWPGAARSGNAQGKFSITTLLGTGQALRHVAPGTYAVDELMPPRGLGIHEPDLLGPGTPRPAPPRCRVTCASHPTPGRRERHLHLHEHRARARTLSELVENAVERQRHLQLRRWTRCSRCRPTPGRVQHHHAPRHGPRRSSATWRPAPTPSMS